MMLRISLLAMGLLALLSTQATTADAYIEYPPCWYGDESSDTHTNLVVQHH